MSDHVERRPQRREWPLNARSRIQPEGFGRTCLGRLHRFPTQPASGRLHSALDSSASSADGWKLPSAPKTPGSQSRKEDPAPSRTVWPEPSRTVRHSSREARLRAVSFLLLVRAPNLISEIPLDSLRAP